MNSGSKNEQIFLEGEKMQLSRKEREYQNHRKEILSAAEGVFAEKGFFSSTMSEIAERAEFGTGTLYKYFKSKEDLYFTLIDEKTDAINHLAKVELARGASPVERIRKVLDLQFEFVEKNRDFFRIYISERNRFEWTMKDELGKGIHDKMVAYIRILTQVMKEGMKEGEFKLMDPTDLAHALVGIVNSFIFEWLISPRPYSLVSKTNVALEIFLKGAQRTERRR
jgi:TetR/AcrR family fatty acid metabolism transcriptional regulator